MTERLYLDSDDLTGEAQVLAAADGVVQLDRTLFHPQGGGQRADEGTLTTADGASVTVTGVRNRPDGGIDHLVSGDAVLAPGDRVTMQVDGEKRRLHARLHSAGHLLALAGERAAPTLRGVQGHHWPGEARVEFEGAVADPARFEADLKAALEHLRQEDPPIAARTVDGVRTVFIGDEGATPCGGTHMAGAAALGPIVVKKIKTGGGRVRVSYDLAD